MTALDYNTISGDIRIRQVQTELGRNAWPEFMQHDAVVEKHWPILYSDFSDFQFAAISGNDIVGIGNSVPIYWEGQFNSLPAHGLDWAMANAFADHRIELAPNLLVGVQILLQPDLRNRGLNYNLLECMKSVARSKGFEYIALPLRPVIKHLYPLVPMNEYILWTNQKGEPYYPWIRVHIKAGGRIISVCPESMIIQGRVKEWQEWTGLSFQNSGLYIIERALSPVFTFT